MTWEGFLAGILFAVGLVSLVAWWVWWIAEEPPRPTPYCPAGPGHALCLHPNAHDRLSCMFCPLDEPLPRGAPESHIERIRWAELHGLLHGQGGRSVAFVEALRGTE